MQGAFTCLARRQKMKHTVSLNENYLFRRLYRTGKCVVDPYVAVYYKKNRLKHNRLGITATKKIGCAVERNRARRIIREAYRLIEEQVPVGLDIVVVARKKAVFGKMQNARHSLLKVFTSSNKPPEGRK